MEAHVLSAPAYSSQLLLLRVKKTDKMVTRWGTGVTRHRDVVSSKINVSRNETHLCLFGGPNGQRFNFTNPKISMFVSTDAYCIPFVSLVAPLTPNDTTRTGKKMAGQG